MTGADVKRQVMAWLHYAGSEGDEAPQQLHDALAPCIVLTAEEAERTANYIRYLHGTGPGIDPLFGGAHALALLTPEEEGS